MKFVKSYEFVVHYDDNDDNHDGDNIILLYYSDSLGRQNKFVWGHSGSRWWPSGNTWNVQRNIITIIMRCYVLTRASAMQFRPPVQFRNFGQKKMRAYISKGQNSIIKRNRNLTITTVSVWATVGVVELLTKASGLIVLLIL